MRYLIHLLLIAIYLFTGGTTFQEKPSRELSDPCKIYGKIKLVENGEDIRVKVVSSGEKLRVRYVTENPSSPGQWELVVSGAQYKVKIVESGEHFTIREVKSGEGCN
ncbi:MAG: hypothetical protein NZ455_08675 [Bacteroidia bacterium]|nr:hypothetical protein [Bacteroidia bacterium]MDW8346945.1 hypothetical protein [Bacteroidia bacterium]